MGREPKSKPVLVLHIGWIDPAHQKLWEEIQREGIGMAFASTQKAGLEKALELQPQVVVIDGSKGHSSPARLCRALLRRLPKVRRLVVTDAGHEDIPCEVCLQHPFLLQKLRKALLNLCQNPAPQVLRVGELQLDLLARIVTGPAGKHHLTPKQTKLLAAFMERPNQVISREDLMDLIWETTYVGDTRTLDVHIRWLREKIEVDPKRPAVLFTKRGVGYVMINEEPSALITPSDELRTEDLLEVE